MNELVFDAPLVTRLRDELLASPSERCAILFANEVLRGDRTRLLIADVDFPVASDYTLQTPIGAELSPHYVAKVVKKARLQDQSIVFVHSHPDPLSAVFSKADDDGEQRLAAFLAHRHPARTHAAMVVAGKGVAARVLGTRRALQVVSLGETRRIHSDDGSAACVGERHDRQVRAFGADGQGVIQQLRVGVVGLGGTGSVLVQQLAHLGTRDFLLIDPDKLETTNLNRVVGSSPEDVGTSKVEIATRTIRHIAPEATVACIEGDVTRASVARTLEEVDFIFICTDSHGSRSVAQQVAYQYRIPAIDVGTVIVANEGSIRNIVARIQLLGTTEGCLWCSKLLNPDEIRRDLMNEQERHLDPYLRGAREPAPAVISLNSTAVSLAVTMYLGVVTAAPIEGRYMLYDGKAGMLRRPKALAEPNCFICSSQGVRGRGDSQPLFARPE